MVGFFLSTVGLGLAFCAAPGAVNTESLRRGLARGFWPAFLVQLGSLVGDLLWAAVALTGTTFLVHNRSVRLLLGVMGACFLLRLAFSSLAQARSGGVSQMAGSPPRGAFLTGAFFSVTNPFAVAFWLGLGAGITATAHTGKGSVATFFAGFLVGALLWCLGSATAVAWGRRFVDTRLVRWINALCGVALGYFGLKLLWSSLRALRVLRLVRVLVG